MDCSTATKKKKRRTRKCLDEIRKRSRRMMRVGCFGESSQQLEKIKKTEECYARNPKLITMNRLTLNMFPKAIRSETITRPILEEIRLKSSHNMGGLDKNTSSIKYPEVECFERGNRAASNNSMPMFDLEEPRQVHGSSPTGIPLRDYPNSNSPTRVNITETPADLIAKIYSTSTTSLSSQTDRDHGLELYEELMSEISSHLKKVSSAIIIEDVIQNTKINLQKLYKTNWTKEYQMSIWEHEKSSKSPARTFQSSKESIVQNPLDYIRLNNVQEQSIVCDTEDCRSEVSGSCSVPSPAAAAASPRSPLALGIGHSHSCTRGVALFDTPEYNYFPHRLNQ